MLKYKNFVHLHAKLKKQELKNMIIKYSSKFSFQHVDYFIDSVLSLQHKNMYIVAKKNEQISEKSKYNKSECVRNDLSDVNLYKHQSHQVC